MQTNLNNTLFDQNAAKVARHDVIGGLVLDAFGQATNDFFKALAAYGEGNTEDPSVNSIAALKEIYSNLSPDDVLGFMTSLNGVNMSLHMPSVLPKLPVQRYMPSAVEILLPSTGPEASGPKWSIGISIGGSF